MRCRAQRAVCSEELRRVCRGERREVSAVIRRADGGVSMGADSVTQWWVEVTVRAADDRVVMTRGGW